VADGSWGMGTTLSVGMGERRSRRAQRAEGSAATSCADVPIHHKLLYSYYTPLKSRARLPSSPSSLGEDEFPFSFLRADLSAAARLT